MTQLETVLKRINATRTNAESSVTSKTAALFEGMDARILKAAKEFAANASFIRNSRDYNPEGRERLMQQKREQMFDPARQSYQNAIQQAKQIVTDSIAEIEVAALPKTDTGADRAANILLWEREIDYARLNDWESMYREHADDKDFMKLLELSAKRDTKSMDDMLKVRVETRKAVSSKRLSELQRLFNNLGLAGYFYELSDYIRESGEFDASNNARITNLKMSTWVDLENFNTAKIPVSTTGV